MPRLTTATLSIPLLFAGLAAPGFAQDADLAERSAVDRAQEIVARVIPHVEKACGARFTEPPRVSTMGATEAAKLFATDMRAEIERRYATATEGQRRTILLASARGSVASCLARYSISGRRIVLVRESFERQRKRLEIASEDASHLLTAVLVHELVHTLDDQRFELRAFYDGAPDSEAMRARAMIAEGRAVVFGRHAAEAAGVPREVRELLPGGREPQSFGEWYPRLTYELGARAVADALDRGGRDLTERLILEPPATTWHLCHPGLPPTAEPDARPAAVLAAAGHAENQTLSELQLRARYAALHDVQTATAVFDPFRGGAQVLTADTNAAVLAFATEEDAERYVELAQKDAPTRALGSLVVRAYGDDAEAVLAALEQAAATLAGERDR